MRLILRCYVTMPAAPRTARDLKFRFGILKFHHFVIVIFRLSFDNKNKLKFYFIIENVASQYPFFRIKLLFVRNCIKFIVNRYFYSIMDSFYFLQRIMDYERY